MAWRVARVVIVAALPVVVFWNSLHGEWVLDDIVWIVENIQPVSKRLIMERMTGQFSSLTSDEQ